LELHSTITGKWNCSASLIEPGPRFANKEVGQGHVVFDILSKSNDRDWLAGLQLLELGGELLVVPANQDQLHAAARLVELSGDVEHHLRPMPSEQARMPVGESGSRPSFFLSATRSTLIFS
jgi:hypothetical protein